jgi:glycosyltransferase involved in cell wall biosynthesis
MTDVAASDGDDARGGRDSGAAMPFTALVAAWNERRNIVQHIESFLALRWAGAELILCAGGDDGTFELAQATARDGVTVIEQRAGEGKQAALRRCFALASRDTIVLTDADCLFERSHLEALLGPLDAGYTVATGGSQPLPHQADHPMPQYLYCRESSALARAEGDAHGVLGRNAAITRPSLVGSGALEADVATGTDFYLSMRLNDLGIPIALVKESRIPSEYPTDRRRYLSMWRRWIKNLMIHDARGHASEFAKAVVLAVLVFAAPVAWLVAPPIVALVLTLPLGIALAMRYRDIVDVHRSGGRVRPATYLSVPYFLVLDQLAVLGAVIDLATVQGRIRW